MMNKNKNTTLEMKIVTLQMMLTKSAMMSLRWKTVKMTDRTEKKPPKVKPEGLPIRDKDAKKLDGEKIEGILHDLLTEMDFAITKDTEDNKKGKAGLRKLGMVDKMCNVLKNSHIQRRFLELEGLELLNRFIGKLPDGSWPLSSVRSRVLNMILTLPTELEHLKSTNLGKTLSNLQTSPHEFKETKKLFSKSRTSGQGKFVILVLSIQGSKPKKKI